MNVKEHPADPRLDEIERAEAWADYREATRDAHGPRYEEIEPWAWARLKQRLRALAARQKARG